MPGLWLWLLLLSIVLLIAFAIVFEFLGAKWYSWFILGLGLVFYFFSIIAYIFRSKKCQEHSKHNKSSIEMTENVVVLTPNTVNAPMAPVANTPAMASAASTTSAMASAASNTPAMASAAPTNTTNVGGQLQKPSRRVGINTDF